MVKMVKQGYPTKRLSREVGVAYKSIKDWTRVYDLYGTEGLRRTSKVNFVPNAEKERMCRLYLEKGLPLHQIYIPNGISRHTLKSWLRKVRAGGYEALYGVSPKREESSDMTRSVNEALREELRKAREENLLLRAENALLKKVKALMEEEEARLKAFGQEPSSH